MWPGTNQVVGMPRRGEQLEDPLRADPRPELGVAQLHRRVAAADESDIASWSKVIATDRRGASVIGSSAGSRPKRSVRDRPVRAETAPSRILGARWPPRNTTTTRSSASRGPRRTPRSSAPSASSPSSGTRTSTRTRRRRSGSRRSTRPTRSCPTRSAASATTCSAGPASDGAGGPGFEGFGGFADIFDAFFGGGQACRRRPARPAAARRGPALRPADHVRGGRQGHREGDRVPRAPAAARPAAARARRRAPRR